MISASVFLCLKSEQERFTASAEGGIKIPIKGRYGFTATGDLIPDSAEVGFAKLEIKTSFDRAKTQIWEAGNGALQFKSSDPGEANSIRLENSRVGPVFSVLGVLPALAHSWSGPDAEYRAVIVAGRRPTAIRLTSLNGSGGREVPLKIEAINFSSLVEMGDAQWAALPWQKAFALIGSFNQETRELVSIGASVPIIGQIRLELNRHERTPLDPLR